MKFRKRTTKSQLQKDLKEIHNKSFEQYRNKMIDTVNNFRNQKKSNQFDNVLSDYNITEGEISKIIDDVCLFGAWIHDRLTLDSAGTTHGKDYKKGLTKKIRKALGFTI